jgi:predicted glycoside hydrolase/deacetylase ChbG (UPF0249 family)
MVLKPAACSAASYCRDHFSLDLGLHLDLGEWTFDGEAWVPVYQVVPLDDVAVVAQALDRQLSDFRRLVGRDPTHLDSHQHFHQDEPVRSAALELARRLNVPLRHFSPVIQYCGRFYGQTARGLPLTDAIAIDSLIAILTDLPSGLTELGCHPGRATGGESTYCDERSTEVDVLSHPKVRTHLRALGIELRSFADIIQH